ncbi:MAG: glutathione S-transferase family protein, partial [Casimicrobiaceae bacterium]
MLKIYGTKTSSNVQKVLWCCGELDLAFERIDIAQTFGGNRSPAYLALNPNGLMPTIDDAGFILWESNAIVRYLAARHGMGKLCPSDLAQRADCERWMDWQQTSIAAPMGVLFRALLRKPLEPIDEAQRRTTLQKTVQAWAILNERLADRPFVGGAALTMADIVLGNAIHRWFKLPVERPALPHLRAWYDRLCGRPAYQQHIA